MCWVQDLGRRKSAKTGKQLKVSTVEQRVSLAKGFLSFKYGFQLVGTAIRLKGFLSKLRGNISRSRCIATSTSLSPPTHHYKHLKRILGGAYNVASAGESSSGPGTIACT